MVPTVVGSILIVGVLTHCALVLSMYDLKAAQVNVQHSLIWEFMLYKFTLCHKAAEATKNICCAKSEEIIDQSTVTRWFKKFHSGYNSQVRSSRPKIIDSKAMLQAIEANMVNSTQNESGELGISLFCLVITFTMSAKTPELPNCTHLTKILQNF